MQASFHRTAGARSAERHKRDLAKALGPAGARIDRLIGYASRIAVLIGVLLIWQWLGDDGAELTMPTFTRTARSFLDLAVNGDLGKALIESNKAMVLGYSLALAVGVPFGVVLGTFSTVRRMATPYLTALLVVPMIAVLPLIQATFGLGLSSRVVVVFLFAVVFISVNTMVGVSEVDPSLREMARSYCAGRMQALRRIVIPAALPSLVAGSRLGLSRAIVGMVIAELFLVSQGVGSLLLYYRSLFDSGAVFALALTMVVEGVIVMRLATLAENVLSRRWLR